MYKSTVFLLLALVALVSADTFSCKFVAEGKQYDLSPLYEIGTLSTGDVKIRLCGTEPECASSVVACNPSVKNDVYGLATSKIHTIERDEDTGDALITQVFRGIQDSSCQGGYKALLVQYSCGSNNGLVFANVDPSNCGVVVQFETPYACLSNSKDTTAVDSDEEPNTSSPGAASSGSIGPSSSGSQGSNSNHVGTATIGGSSVGTAGGGSSVGTVGGGSSTTFTPTAAPTAAPTPAPTQPPAKQTVSVTAQVAQKFEGDKSQFNLTTYSDNIRAAITSTGVVTVTSSFTSSSSVSTRDVTTAFTVYSTISASYTTKTVDSTISDNFRTNLQNSIYTATPIVAAQASASFNATAVGSASVAVGNIQTAATTYLWKQFYTTSRCSNTPYAASTVESGDCAAGVAYVYDDTTKSVIGTSCSEKGSNVLVSVTDVSSCVASTRNKGSYEKWAVGKSSYFPFVGGPAQAYSTDNCKSTDFYYQYNPSSCYPTDVIQNNKTVYASIACTSGSVVVENFQDQFCRASLGSKTSPSNCFSVTSDISASFTCPNGDTPSKVFNSAPATAINVFLVVIFALIALF